VKGRGRKGSKRGKSNMIELKKDAIVVADALKAVAPTIARKIRRNFDIVATTEE
jgi:hypothetical protein